MKDVTGKRVLVVGLARSGRAAALLLKRRGATVTISDVKPPGSFSDVLPELVAARIGFELGAQREETFRRQDLIVISPGVPWDLPQLERARERGIPVVPEVEAAAWFLPGTVLGITGSNGKTTTTTLLGEMLKASGYATFVGGNIGLPLSMAVDQTPPPELIVTELSSFQLEGIQAFHPHVVVVLNLSPNHLDRHPDFTAYAQAKAQIFRHQTPQDYAILNADDPEVMKLAENIAARKVLFSCQQDLLEGVTVAGGQVLYRVGYLERPLFAASDLRLRGSFNLENALAAAAAACVVGADFHALRQAVRAFQGVEHRLEFVAKLRGVEFYNNSKATSVDATVKSLGAFEGGVHLIMGGKDKGAPYASILPLLKNRVRYVYLIGAAAGRIERELSGAVELVPAGDLETALRKAFARAIPGEVVLLAPACSSFDQFQDYEQRGRVFKEVVQRLQQAPRERGGSDVWQKTGAPVPPAAQPEPSPPAEPTSANESEPSVPSDGESDAPAGDESPASAAFPVMGVVPVSVYEVAAEECTSATDAGAEPVAEASAAMPRPAEKVNDEPIPFEIRDFSSRGAAGSAPMKTWKRKDRRGVAEPTEEADENSEGQERLPGF